MYFLFKDLRQPFTKIIRVGKKDCNIMRRKISYIMIGIFILVSACQKFAMVERDTQISKHGEDESHYKGFNCMDCHYTEGNDAEGIFLIGGSAYGNTDKGFVEFYEDKNAAPIKVVEIDQLGNYYTTEEDIDFKKGLYVAVVNKNNNREFMDDKVLNGQCNLCHGTGIEDRIDMD